MTTSNSDTQSNDTSLLETDISNVNSRFNSHSRSKSETSLNDLVFEAFSESDKHNKCKKDKKTERESHTDSGYDSDDLPTTSSDYSENEDGLLDIQDIKDGKVLCIQGCKCRINGKCSKDCKCDKNCICKKNSNNGNGSNNNSNGNSNNSNSGSSSSCSFTCGMKTFDMFLVYLLFTYVPLIIILALIVIVMIQGDIISSLMGVVLFIIFLLILALFFGIFAIIYYNKC